VVLPVVEVVVEMVVEGTGRRRGGSSLCSGVRATRVVLAAEKGMPAAVVAAMERRVT
jgi:hypothetical protein